MVFAKFRNTTLCTFRRTSSAYVASVENEPMMGMRHERFGNVLDECFFGFEWGATIVGETNAVSYAKNMCVDCHSGLSETYGGDDIGGFATNAR
jgi:hypothetical protein